MKRSTFIKRLIAAPLALMGANEILNEPKRKESKTFVGLSHIDKQYNIEPTVYRTINWEDSDQFIYEDGKFRQHEL